MKSINIYSLGAPPTFTLTPADDGYNTERVSYELSMMLYLASQEGMSLSVTEETDYSDFIDQIEVFVANVETYMDTAEPDEEFDWNTLLTITDTVPLAVSGGWGTLLILIVKVAIYLAIKWLEKRWIGKGGGGGLTEEQVASLLEKLDAMVAQEPILSDYMGKSIWTKSHIVDGSEE